MVFELQNKVINSGRFRTLEKSFYRKKPACADPWALRLCGTYIAFGIHAMFTHLAGHSTTRTRLSANGAIPRNAILGSCDAKEYFIALTKLRVMDVRLS